MTDTAMPSVVIYTDGACKGNPGRGGWGVWMVSGEHEREMWGGELVTTNNRMELTAVIQALTVLKRRCNVIIYTDSEYVRKGITEWIHGWKRNGWKTADRKPVKNADLWIKLDELARQLRLDDALKARLERQARDAAGQPVTVARAL